MSKNTMRMRVAYGIAFATSQEVAQSRSPAHVYPLTGIGFHLSLQRWNRIVSSEQRQN